MKEFIVYKGEQMVAMGTAEECATILGVKPTTIRWYRRPVAQKRQAARKKPDKCITVDILEGDD